jgi:hypothetical protein
MTNGSEVLMTEFTLTEGSMPGGPGLTTSGNCLNWFATQTDKMIFNRDYESIVTSGLTLNLDAGFSPSFATIPSNANSSTVTPWYDLSTNGRNGTLTNGPTFSSTGGGSIVFDGVDDYINNIGTTSSFSFIENTGIYTISFWAKPANITNVYALAVNNKGSRAFKGFGIYTNLIGSNGAVTLDITQIGDPPIMTLVINNAFVNTTDWVNIVFIGNYPTVSGYRNGTYIGGNTCIKQITGDSYQPLSLSSTNFGSSNNYYFNGSLAIFQIYNRALTSSEVIQNYNAQKGRFGL